MHNAPQLKLQSLLDCTDNTCNLFYATCISNFLYLFGCILPYNNFTLTEIDIGDFFLILLNLNI